MRKLLSLLAFALLVPSGAHASEEWLEMENQAGGKILLLNSGCKVNDNSQSRGRLVISTSPSGTSTNGCWYFFADMIHIAWERGTTSSFDPNDFTYRRSK